MNEVLKESGAVKSKYDDAIFYWQNNSKLEGVLCCHVDNCIWRCTPEIENLIINESKKIFLVSSQETFK